MEPYVQNTTDWVSYYTNGIKRRNGNNLQVSDADTSTAPNGGSMSEIGSMSVSQVEAKAPLPPVPSAGAMAALKNVTSSQAAIQQATFEAMRARIDSNGKSVTKAGGGSGRGRKAKKRVSDDKVKKGSKSTQGRKDKTLMGTPRDIFQAARSRGRGGGRGSKKK